MNFESFSFLFPERKKNNKIKLRKNAFLVFLALLFLVVISLKMYNTFTTERPSPPPPEPEQGLMLDGS
jgi:hypothetical protein